MSDSRRVHAMDRATSALVAASYVIPDLVIAVQEAVYNAIDAHTRQLSLTVDLVSASFTIVDDGDGIHPDAIYEQLFEHAVSSITEPQSKRYGTRGQFLLSLGCLAKEVELESRIEAHWTSFRKVLQRGHVVFNARSKTPRTTRGTRLRVENLFSLLPVRQRDLQSHATSRARIARRLRAFLQSISLIWPTLSIDVSFVNASTKVPRLAIEAAKTCEERLVSVFGETLGRQLEYVTYETRDSPFTVRGYVAVIADGSDSVKYLNSPGWRQARAYYQFCFLDNCWVADFHEVCCKIINNEALELELGIPIYVLKISGDTNEYELLSDGETCIVNLKQPERLKCLLTEFVGFMKTRTEGSDQTTDSQRNREPPKGSALSTGISNEIRPASCRDERQLDVVALESAQNASSRGSRNLEVDMEEAYLLGNQVSAWDSVDEMWSNEGTRFESIVSRDSCYAGDSCVIDEDEAGREFVLGDVFQPEEEAYADWGKEDPIGYSAYQRLCAECASCACHSRFADAATTGRHVQQQEMSSAVQDASDGCAHDIWYDNELECYDEDQLWEVDDGRCPLNSSYSDAEDTGREADADADLYESVDASRPHFRSLRDEIANGVFFGSGMTAAVLAAHDAVGGGYEQSEEMSSKAFWVSSRRVGTVTASDREVTPQKLSEDPTGSQSRESSKVLSQYFSMKKLPSSGAPQGRRSLLCLARKRTTLGVPVHHTISAVDVKHLPSDLHTAREMTIDKSIFQRLEVIKQVDRKFILVKATESRREGDEEETGRTLLLCIDQHAADERVRLEELERQVFGASGEERNIDIAAHDPPLTVSLNNSERESLAFFHDEIRAWGFVLAASPRDGIMQLTHTPQIDRRVADADNFREYLRVLATSDGHIARRVLRPPVITRFLHSRACRSAIMFGDYLSISQCRDLVEQLSHCQLPFQCAHGRPSIVPLVDIH